MKVILAGFYYPHHTISPHYKGIFAVCPAPSLNSALSVRSCPGTVHMTCGSRRSYRAALQMNSVISLVLCALYVCCLLYAVIVNLYHLYCIVSCVCVHVVVCSVCTCMCNCVHLCMYVICVCVYMCVCGCMYNYILLYVCVHVCE